MPLRQLRHGARVASSQVAQHLDRAFVRFAFRDRRRGAPRLPEAGEAAPGSLRDDIAAVARFYADADRQGRLFASPPRAPRLEVRRTVRSENDGRVVEVTWPSAYEPLHDDYARALARCPQNGTCWARWYQHPTPAPALVCLHGWGGGSFAMDERMLPVPWLHRRLGLDVLLVALPFHGLRGAGRDSPAFPSASPIRSNEGFAQAVSDLTSLRLALAEHGAPWVGVAGMSLGGFTSALLATVDPEWAVVMPLIPFASLPHMIWHHGSHTESRRQASQAGLRYEDYAEAFAATTPLRRPPCVDPRRVLIVAGRSDRVTTPEQAEALHEHFPGSRLTSFPGGHVLQFGRQKMFRAIGKFLGGHGLI